MPCNNPIWGWPAAIPGKTGKRQIVFDQAKAQPHSRQQPVRCGTCAGCQMDRRREWAIRCHHEAQLHEENAFITLTFDEDNLPEDNSLNKKHFQDFMKRLRGKYCYTKDYSKSKKGRTISNGRQIRYFHCGEYGPENGRPHYHALLFGFQFRDLILYTQQDGYDIYISEELSTLWGQGFATTTDVNFKSASYVAGYVTQKLQDEENAKWEGLDLETGEIYYLQPPYITMSLKPGIGSKWFQKYSKDCFPKDYITVDGSKLAVPSYYNGKYEEQDPDTYQAVKVERLQRALENPLTQQQREAREKRTAQLNRRQGGI